MNNNINYHEEVPVICKSIDLYFGIIGSFFFFVVSLLPLLTGDRIRLWSVYIGSMLLMLSYLFPVALTPLRKLWIRFGLRIQKITQPLILGMVFYVLITTIALIMRLFGKDPLLLKKNLGETSCWKLRYLDQVNTDMKNQF